MTKMTIFEKFVFQEGYRVSRRPVYDLQFLLSPILPIVEVRAKDLKAKWYPSAIMRKPCERDLRRKQEIETEAAYYGRRSITKPWYNHDKSNISKSRLLQIIAPIDDRRNPKNSFNQSPHIAIHVIPIRMRDNQKIQLLILMDSYSALTSILPYERLGGKSITKAVCFFLDQLESIKLPRTDLRFVSPTTPVLKKGMDIAKKNLKKDILNISIRTDLKYTFREQCSLDLKLNQETLKRNLKPLLFAYNIGELSGRHPKRTGPFLAIERNLRERRENITEEWLIKKIKRILQISPRKVIKRKRP